MDVALLVFLIVGLLIAVGLLAGREKLTESENLGWRFYAGVFWGALTLGLLILVASDGLLQNAYDWLINGECECDGISGAELFYYAGVPAVAFITLAVALLQFRPFLEDFEMRRNRYFDSKIEQNCERLANPSNAVRLRAIHALDKLVHSDERSRFLSATDSAEIPAFVGRVLIAQIEDADKDLYQQCLVAKHLNEVEFGVSSATLIPTLKALDRIRSALPPQQQTQAYTVRQLFLGNIGLQFPTKNYIEFVRGIYSRAGFHGNVEGMVIEGIVGEFLRFENCNLQNAVLEFIALPSLIDNEREKCKIEFVSCYNADTATLDGNLIPNAATDMTFEWSNKQDRFVRTSD